MKEKDIFTRAWIIENSIQILREYGPGELTVRSLYYRLVSRGMTNSQAHYKRVVAATTAARWDGTIGFLAFSDHEREVLGRTESEETDLDAKITEAENQVSAWIRSYSKNRWENQPVRPEIWIEKKALQGVFLPQCGEQDVSLSACKGYPSLTFLDEASRRFKAASKAGKLNLILYFGDYDPSGEDIPRSIAENLQRLGATVIVKRVALLAEQVIKWQLPPAPAKETDSRTSNWDGFGQVELDAVEIRTLKDLIRQELNACFDDDLGRQLKEQERREGAMFREALKDFVINYRFD